MSEDWVSNDYRSKLGDCIAMLSYWLKNLVPFFSTKLHVIASSSDWFIALLGPVGIGRSNYVIVF